MHKVKLFATLFASSSLLSACYVVPVNHAPVTSNSAYPAYSNVAVVAVRPIYTARLYPTNEAAAAVGRVSGTITNPERGQGEFSFVLAGENFVGEATRASGTSRGTANATGNRGGYAKCSYTMTSSVLGTGTCTFSSGAAFDMHISQ